MGVKRHWLAYPQPSFLRADSLQGWGSVELRCERTPFNGKKCLFAYSLNRLDVLLTQSPVFLLKEKDVHVVVNDVTSVPKYTASLPIAIALSSLA